MNDLKGCYVVSDDEFPLKLMTYSEFTELTRGDLHQFNISLPDGVEGEYYMYIQQDRQDPRIHYFNPRASIMAGQDIYADVLLIQKDHNDKTLTEWRVFTNLKFPKLTQLEEMQRAAQEVDKCVVQ